MLMEKKSKLLERFFDFILSADKSDHKHNVLHPISELLAKIANLTFKNGFLVLLNCNTAFT